MILFQGGKKDSTQKSFASHTLNVTGIDRSRQQTFVSFIRSR